MDKMQHLKTQLNHWLKLGEEWVHQLREEHLRQIPPTQLYVAVGVVCLTFFFLLLSNSQFLTQHFCNHYHLRAFVFFTLYLIKSTHACVILLFICISFRCCINYFVIDRAIDLLRQIQATCY